VTAVGTHRASFDELGDMPGAPDRRYNAVRDLELKHQRRVDSCNRTTVEIYDASHSSRVTTEAVRLEII
jgi:hypothetical protein